MPGWRPGGWFDFIDDKSGQLYDWKLNKIYQEVFMKKYITLSILYAIHLTKGDQNG